MKKAKHKYSLGDIVTIEWMAGGKYTGEITELTYMGERVNSPNYNLPQYLVSVKNPKGSRAEYTHYPVSDERIISVNGKTTDLLSERLNKKRGTSVKTPDLKSKSTSKKRKKKSELDEAIENQKDFIRGTIKKDSI